MLRILVIIMALSLNAKLAHADEEYRTTFKDILKNAIDQNGNKILSFNDNEEVFAKNHKVFSSGLKLEKVFGNHLPKVSEALNSDYGRSKINEIYDTELDVIVAHLGYAYMKIICEHY